MLNLTHQATNLETYVRDAGRHIDGIQYMLRELEFLARQLSREENATSDELDRVERSINEVADALASLVELEPKLVEAHTDLKMVMGV